MSTGQQWRTFVCMLEREVYLCVYGDEGQRLKLGAFLDHSPPYGAHQFSYTSWLVSPRSPSVPNSPVLILHVYADMPDFTSFS